MRSLRAICRFIAIIIGFSFLFGQLFFDDFGIAQTVTGIFGMAVGIGSRESKMQLRASQVTVSIFGALGLLGVIFDAIEYYTNYSSPGNYYAWFLIGPYIFAIIVIMYQFRIRFGNDVVRDIDT